MKVKKRKKIKYEMNECNEFELEWKNTTNGYGSEGLSIFCADIEYRPYMQLVQMYVQ